MSIAFLLNVNLTAKYGMVQDCNYFAFVEHSEILTLALRKSILMHQINSEKKIVLLILEAFILNTDHFTNIFNVMMPNFNLALG